MGTVRALSRQEQERLGAVRRYAILDTPPDGAFDRIAALAARIFDVPIATVSIVDHDRIWFKAVHGLEVEATDRVLGLCASAILHHDPYIMTDALTDPRALENPLVHGDLGVRFYAAAPITTRDGHRLGTVNVIGSERREVTEDEIATLKDLADIAVDELELRLAARRTVERERTRARQQAAVAELGVWAMDTDDPRSVGTFARDKAAELLGPDMCVELAWDPAAATVDPDHGVTVAIGDVGVLMVTGSGTNELASVDHDFLHSLAHVVDASAQRHEAATELRHLATHDQLTTLPNRRLFLDRLGQVRAAAQRSDERFAVLFFDLDRFKTINDSFGHETGDEVLRQVADRLRRIVRPADSVARFGGDEFALLCPGIADEHTVAMIAERIRAALDKAFHTEHGPVHLTASIGIAFGDRTTDGSTLLHDADTAMYGAKTAGRNLVKVFDGR